jgi:hypothetical protein
MDCPHVVHSCFCGDGYGDFRRHDGSVGLLEDVWCYFHLIWNIVLLLLPKGGAAMGTAIATTRLINDIRRDIRDLDALVESLRALTERTKAPPKPTLPKLLRLPQWSQADYWICDE